MAKTRQLQGRNKFGLAKPSKASASALADLRREVDVMRALNHPNLVKLYEVIDAKEAGKLMMVMEYCEAGALVRPGQLSPERRMPEAIAQYYFRQMASGLAYLHEKGVVHGDVKPENILLSGDAVVKISDFGGSQLVGESGDDTFCQTLGTPAFLAPEICAGEDYRGRPADVWALGVSLYNFIFGELPFRGDSLMELYDSIAAAEVPFPEAVPVSIELQDLLVRTLCKDPGARITAAELMHHPWVKEEDLGALLPTLFSDEAALEGATMRLGSPTSDAGSVGGRSGASSPPLRNASTGSGMGGGNLNSPAPAYSMLRMGESMAVPAPGDVAAAVFPMLSEQAPSGAFTLGPQASIIGALMRAGGPQPKPAPVSTSRLHYLSKDSMLRKELERDDSEAGGSEAGSRPGHSRNVSELSDLPFGGSDLPDFSSTAEEGPTVGSEARGTTAGNEIAVDRSAPSAFTLMANRMTAAQAELIGRRASGPVPKTAQPAPISGPGKLDTILETSFIDDLSFSGSLGGSPSGGATASSAPAAPVDDGNLLSATSTAESNVSLIGIASDPLPSLDKATMEDAAAAATATAKASAAGGQRGGTPPRRPVLAGNIDIPRPALQRSSLGLEFSGASVAQREPSALPICSPFESDAFASMSFSAFAQQPSANSQASLHPGTTAASSAHPSGDEDSGTGNGGSVVTPEGDAQQHASEKRTVSGVELQQICCISAISSSNFGIVNCWRGAILNNAENES